MGHVNGGGGNHALVRRFTSLGATVATAATMLFVVITNAGASPAAQINIQAIVCPILFAIRAAFANTRFAPFVTPILNSLLARFGCTSPSG